MIEGLVVEGKIRRNTVKREQVRNQHKVEDEGGVGPLNPNLLKKTTRGQVSSKGRLITENYLAGKENNVLIEIF